MKELTLCEKLGVKVGITRESWHSNDVKPSDFVCSYADAQDSYVDCSKDGNKCPIYDIIQRRMKK